MPSHRFQSRHVGTIVVSGETEPKISIPAHRHYYTIFSTLFYVIISTTRRVYEGADWSSSDAVVQSASEAIVEAETEFSAEKGGFSMLQNATFRFNRLNFAKQIVTCELTNAMTQVRVRMGVFVCMFNCLCVRLRECACVCVNACMRVCQRA